MQTHAELSPAPVIRSTSNLRRQLVVSGTGEPVELIHIEQRGDRRSYCVERACGSRWTLTEPQLESRYVYLH